MKWLIAQQIQKIVQLAYIELVLAIAQNVETLNHRLPRKRKPWLAEDPHQSPFDAVSLAITDFVTAGGN